MKIRRLTAIILAVVMLAATCCSILSGCSEVASGNGVYTITFNANGGTVNPKSAVTTDGKLSSLPTPYKENTEFLGWYLSSAFAGERLTVSYNYSFSCLIHAKWGETVATEYTVSFNANGGTLAAGTEAMVTVNSKLLAFPADPTPPANCSFLGWYTQKVGGEKVDTAYEFTDASKNVTIYAQYAQEYVITFDAGVGTITEKFRLTTNGKLMGLPSPTGVPEDRSFVAWYTKSDGGKRVNSSTVFTADSTIYARYLMDGESIVTLDANGGKISDDDAEEIFTTGGGLVGELPEPTPSKGYGFYGWFTAPAGGEQVSAGTKFTDNEIIYAQYIMVEFFVSFNANGGELSEEVLLITDGYKLERLPYRPFAPPGLRFVGWFTEKVGGDPVDTDYLFTITGTPGARTLYAHYEEAQKRNDGLWLEDVTLPDIEAQRGDFSDLKENEVWAYDVNFKGNDIALEIWYNYELLTDIKLDEYSTDKVIMTPDKMLRLAEGADIANSIINVSYRFDSKVIYVQEIIRADIQDNDGVYIGKTKQMDLDQNIASAEIIVENLEIQTGGTTELTIVLGGETVEIAHFGMDELIKARLASDRKNIIIAAGIYTLYYKYGVTDATSSDYKSLWISGISTGDLPATADSDSPYYMVGSSGTLGLTWNTIASTSLIPENIHLQKSGDNTYSITVDLYEGNEFKILMVGGTWTIGAFDYTSLTGNTGSTKYFSGNADNNIIVGTSGNYTLTINTDTNKLSFVRNGEAPEIKTTYDIYIHGSYVASWQSRLASPNQTAGTVTFEYTLTAELEFGIRTTVSGKSAQIGWGAYSQLAPGGNKTNGGILKASSNTNFICKKSGTYRFTITLSSSGQISAIKIDTVE